MEKLESLLLIVNQIGRFSQNLNHSWLSSIIRRDRSFNVMKNTEIHKVNHPIFNVKHPHEVSAINNPVPDVKKLYAFDIYL